MSSKDLDSTHVEMAAADIRGMDRFVDVCLRRQLHLPAGECKVSIRNALLSTASSFCFCVHSNLLSNDVVDHSSDEIQVPFVDVNICEIQEHDVLEHIDDPARMMRPWPFKDVLTTFCQAHCERQKSIHGYNMSRSDTMITRCFRRIQIMLMEAESMLVTINWQPLQPPKSWGDPETNFVPWNAVHGRIGADRFIVVYPNAVEMDVDGEDSFTLYVNEEFHTILQLPRDIAEAAYVYATESIADSSVGDQIIDIPSSNALYQEGLSNDKAQIANNVEEAGANKENDQDALPTTAWLSAGIDFNMIPKAKARRSPQSYRPLRSSKPEANNETATIPQDGASAAVVPKPRRAGRRATAPQSYWYTNRKCHRNQCINMLDTESMYLCAWCKAAVYCSSECLHQDWNRGVHVLECVGAEEDGRDKFPECLAPFKKLVASLGPHARDIYNLCDAQLGFFFVDLRYSVMDDPESDSARDSRMFSWISDREMFASPLVSEICRLNREQMINFLASYSPMADFLVVVRTDKELSMHKLAISNLVHDNNDVLCCCDSCAHKRRRRARRQIA